MDYFKLKTYDFNTKYIKQKTLQTIIQLLCNRLEFIDFTNILSQLLLY